MTGLSLAAPWFLLLAAPVALVLVLALRRGTRALPFAPAALFGGGRRDGDDSGPLPRTWRTRMAPLPRALQAAGVVLAVVALSRPVLRDRLPLETEGLDVVLCLDVSSSMTAEDLAAGRSRLEVAKDVAARFVSGRPHDRIGLVCFARYPDVRCPPTLDHDALLVLLAGVTTVASDGPEDATGIGTAVARTAQVLRGAPGSKVAVLLTDGAENVATSAKPGEIAPVHAAQLCAELGVRVHAVVAGSSAAGTSAAPDTRQVRRLSERTGGRFFRAEDAEALAAVYASIDEMERVTLPEPRYRTEERFAPFLLAAVVLLFAGTLLRATVLDVLP